MKRVTAAAILVALAATPTLAQNVRISGFGQVVAGAMTEDGRSIPTLAYNSTDVDFRQESLFALQVSGELTPGLDAVAQIVARGATDYEADFSWAYLNWTPDDHWNLKLGRQRRAAFGYSDFLDVGYAYPWMRPPIAIYNRFLTNFDGLSATYTRNFGDWRIDATWQGGAFDGDAISAGTRIPMTADGYSAYAIDLGYQEWLSFRLHYATLDFGLLNASTVLGNDLRAAGQPDLARIIDLVEDPAWFGQVGFKIDRWDWIIEGEVVGQRISNSLAERDDDWYLSVARRWGLFTPYVVYGQRRSQPDFDLLARVSPSNPFFGRIRTLVLADESDDRFYSVGVRWDLRPNVALKADWTGHRPTVAGRRDANLVSGAVVFTF